VKPGTVAAALLAVLSVAGCSADRQAPTGTAASPTGDTDRWRSDPDEPYPFVTPIPPDTPTPVDGRYVRTLTAAGGAPRAIPCRRCAPYRLVRGRAVITFEGGRFHLVHQAANFRASAHYLVEGDRLILFNDPNCSHVRGIYRWSLDGGNLSLEVVEDDCAFDLLRARYLSAAPWEG
jgi:hypothetical protein